MRIATLFALIIVGALCFLFPIAAALAQSPGAVASDTVVSFGGFVAALLPYVVEILTVLVLALAAWVAKTLKTKFDVDISDTLLAIEAKHRVTLHSALTTGINMALDKAGVDLANLTVDVKFKLAKDAVEWVLTKGAADAVDHFGLTPEAVAKMALGKLAGEGIAFTDKDLEDLKAMAGGLSDGRVAT